MERTLILNAIVLRQRLHPAARDACPLPAHQQYLTPHSLQQWNFFWIGFTHTASGCCFDDVSQWLRFRSRKPRFTSLASALAPTNPFKGQTRVGAIACDPLMLLHERRLTHGRTYELVHISEDKLCVWWPPADVLQDMRRFKHIKVHWLHGRHQETPWLGRANHGYGHLLGLTVPNTIKSLSDLEKVNLVAIPEFYTSSLLRVLTWCAVRVDPSVQQLWRPSMKARSPSVVTSLVQQIELTPTWYRKPR